jgi:Family of unknown function (DUF5681)
LPSSLFPDAIGEQEPAGDRERPRSTRFRPGQSGNPRGRPKGARSLRGLVASALGERVEAKENGRRRRITKLEAAVKQLVNRAASGDQRATQFVFALLGEDKERAAPVAIDPEADALVIAELVRRLSPPPE